jgi:hypothetical protein
VEFFRTIDLSYNTSLQTITIDSLLLSSPTTNAIFQQLTRILLTQIASSSFDSLTLHLTRHDLLRDVPWGKLSSILTKHHLAKLEIVLPDIKIRKILNPRSRAGAQDSIMNMDELTESISELQELWMQVARELIMKEFTKSVLNVKLLESIKISFP